MPPWKINNIDADGNAKDEAGPGELGGRLLVWGSGGPKRHLPFNYLAATVKFDAEICQRCLEKTPTAKSGSWSIFAVCFASVQYPPSHCYCAPSIPNIFQIHIRIDHSPRWLWRTATMLTQQSTHTFLGVQVLSLVFTYISSLHGSTGHNTFNTSFHPRPQRLAISAR